MKTSFSDFYQGKIYSSKWLIECLARGKLVPCDEYIVSQNTNTDARKLNIAKKKKYTIIEGIRLYELITNQRNSQVGSQQYWLKIANNGYLPERTADSMKNFWKK